MVTLKLEYNIDKNTFDVETNAEDPKGLVSEFLRNQVGSGEDENPASLREIYSITLEFDVEFDSFTCYHNCGNLGFRDGILLNYLRNCNVTVH